MLLGTGRVVGQWQKTVSSTLSCRPPVYLHHRAPCSTSPLALKVHSILRFGDTGRGPSYLSSCSISSSSSFSSVVFRKRFFGQQQGKETRRESDASRLVRTIIVDQIASTDDTTTNLNRKPLYDELQRYGLDESDYDCASGFNVVDDMAKRKTVSSNGIPRKRKVATGLTVKEEHPTLKEESGVNEDWCAYLLLSSDSQKTYVGVTYDIRRRLRQHNGEIGGGAKSARAGRPWRLVCTVHGFNTRSEACQFEWRWKRTAAKMTTISQLGAESVESPLVTRRRATLSEVLLAQEEWGYLNVQWHPQ